MHLWAITLVLPALLISCAHSQQQQRQTSTVTQEKSSATYQTLPNPSTTSAAGTVGANVYKDSFSGHSQSGQDVLKYYSYPQPNVGANVQQQQQQYYSYYYPQHAAYNPAQGTANVLGTDRFGLGGSGGKGGDSGRGQGWGQAETPAPSYGPVQSQGWGQSQGDSQGSMNGFGGLGNILGGSNDSNGGGGIFDTLTTMLSGMFSALGLGSMSDDMSSMDQMGYGNGGGWGQPMMMNDGAGGAGGGAGGIIGLLVGKKAGILKTKALMLLLSPILIPLALLVIAAIVAIVLAIPIPVYMPSINDGRDLQGSIIQKSSVLARTLLESESCVERIACEIMSTTKTYIPADWTQRQLTNFGGHWRSKLNKSFSTARSGKGCDEYKCSKLSTPLRMAQDFFTFRGESKMRRQKNKKNKKPTIAML